jgi:hypothetical protein
VPSPGRALLVVTALSCGGASALRPLHRLLDAGAALLGRWLGRRYARVVVLRGGDVTRRALPAAVRLLSRSPGVSAIDVFLNVHGRLATLTLADAEVPVEVLAGALRRLGAPAVKLRLLYSTACHAAHHAVAFREAGFRTCLGARCINASGAVETPLFLALWAGGLPAGRAIRIADHRAARGPADALARLVLRAVGEKGRVDSEKVLSGDDQVTIASEPASPPEPVHASV